MGIQRWEMARWYYSHMAFVAMGLPPILTRTTCNVDAQNQPSRADITIFIADIHHEVSPRPPS